jgi:hypothetical protein
MLRVEDNGLDLELIAPDKGAKYSPNLYQWMKAQERRKRAWAMRVYRDVGNSTFWIGMLDGRELIGSKLIGVLCNGAKEHTAAWQNIDAVEISGFWIDYVANGRCAIDIDHSICFINDESRWSVNGAHRDCVWCGKASQRLAAVTHTEWVTV